MYRLFTRKKDQCRENLNHFFAVLSSGVTCYLFLGKCRTAWVETRESRPRLNYSSYQVDFVAQRTVRFYTTLKDHLSPSPQNPSTINHISDMLPIQVTGTCHIFFL
jgi:hypothetical protein